MTQLESTVTRSEFESEYQVGKVLGTGGMGEVKSALQLKLNRTVAIKFMRADVLGSDQAVQRFLRESRILASLSHPNIIQVYDFGVLEGSPFLVMELLPGGSLVEIFEKEGALAPRRALDLLIPAAKALAYLHEQNILHRDIKPRNIMIDADGAPRLADFGLSRDMDRKTLLTTEGAIMGSPLYIAPEVLMGQGATPAADVYSFGCSLYAALSSELPYGLGHGGARSVMMRKVNQDPKPILDHVPDLPEALVEVVHRCLVRNPKKRYATGSDVARALRIAARAIDPDRRRSGSLIPSSSTASSSGREGAPARIGSDTQPLPKGRRVPWPVLALASVAVLVALAGLGYFLNRPQAVNEVLRATEEPLLNSAILTYRTSLACPTVVVIERGGTAAQERGDGPDSQDHRIDLTDLLPGEEVVWWPVVGGEVGTPRSFNTLADPVRGLRVLRGYRTGRVELRTPLPARVRMVPLEEGPVFEEAEPALEHHLEVRGLDPDKEHRFRIELLLSRGAPVDGGEVVFGPVAAWMKDLLTTANQFKDDRLFKKIQKGILGGVGQGKAWLSDLIDDARGSIDGFDEIQSHPGLVGEFLQQPGVPLQAIDWTLEGVMRMDRLEHAARFLGLRVPQEPWSLLGDQYWRGFEPRLTKGPESTVVFKGGRLIVVPFLDRAASLMFNERPEATEKGKSLVFQVPDDPRPVRAEICLELEGMGRGTEIGIQFPGKGSPRIRLFDFRTTGTEKPVTRLYAGFPGKLIPSGTCRLKVLVSALPWSYKDTGIRLYRATLRFDLPAR